MKRRSLIKISAGLFLGMAVALFCSNTGKAATQCAKIDYVDRQYWGSKYNVEKKDWERLGSPLSGDTEYYTDSPEIGTRYQVTASHGAIVTFGTAKKQEETQPDSRNEDGDDVYIFTVTSKMAKNGGSEIVTAKLGEVETKLEVEFKKAQIKKETDSMVYKAIYDLSDPACEYGKITATENGEELKKYSIRVNYAEDGFNVSDKTEDLYRRYERYTIINGEVYELNKSKCTETFSSLDEEFMEYYNNLPWDYDYNNPDVECKHDYLKTSYTKTTPEMWNQFMKPLVREGATVYVEIIENDKYTESLYYSTYQVTDTKWTVSTQGTVRTDIWKAGKIKIAKQKKAPSVKVDAVKGILSTKANMQYQYKAGKFEGGEYSEWTNASVKMPLTTVTNAAVLASGVSIRIRTAGSSKTVPSKYLTIEIPSRTAIDASKIQLEGVLTNASIKASDQDNKTKLYEYMTAQPSSTAKWTVMSNKGIILKGKKALTDGSKIYIREKGINENAKNGIKLKMPSTILEITVSGAATTWIKQDYDMSKYD